ncbi:MetQ/NlpA family ABC transporter substrate-binding protein [Pediococcus ethanolidurans]|uniref:D-methionine transport system substrate-binding protein n=1 Tax=Pediococcus ethanolidurans TaxID=319653 RepID=A0A0R2JWZ7_9LACO|nr:MetQ/NlpA family ABC transporter substrate-binding protein [Pediococcus ethanolidurans]KRN81744.1 NLPA lipoprotein [Pediococcus ethanolidurans]MBU7554983.1 metal ABC transporter substrate-binding protein [Pediococcus ethanolidurans]MBU7563789.1 metal ABC transporter substrate-binding protein [Pediococcus ethanolidurans]MCT4397906.1 metal ABC transporter substrate-binding protein [Pediococcus ethanolidurans]MCV3316039.1 MetQ/NlpA family ABC transporter substrate-binding protein [Pediococcus 
MKKSVWWVLGVIVVLVVAVLGVHQLSHSAKAKTTTITVGSMGSDYDIWKHIAKSNDAKEAGLKIKVQQVTDGVQLNNGTAQGNIDVNAFQSYSYYEAYNKQHPKQQLSALGTTYLEPMGIYSKKYKKVSQIPDGATIAIANNPANTARDLLLLQSAGLIKLKANFSALGNVSDIKSNPKNLKFKEIDDTTGPRVLKDVDAVLISNTVALEGHLHVLTDSIFHEKIDQSTRSNINILATAKKNAHNAKYKKLVKLYHKKDIQRYIKDKYYGTKIEVQKPIAYLK